MRTYLALISILTFSMSSFAGVKPLVSLAKEKEKKDAAAFWHHCGEFHVTPSTDYFLYQKGDLVDLNKPYEYQMPFIGFDIGGQYMYRPVEVFAVSAGLGFRMQGSYYRHTDYFLGDKFVDQTIARHTGFLNVPIEFHLFKRMQHCTFEFATGPRFNFPVFRTFKSSMFNADGDEVLSAKDKDKLSTTDMRENSSLGWNILLGADLHLFDKGDLFIGPQINFVDLVYFDKDARQNIKDYGNNIDCSLGLKLGFRFHCENSTGY